jgi:hypothetical protein
MPLIISKVGLAKLLANSLQYGAAAFPARVGLFINNYSPTVNDTIANYAEPVRAWYLRQPIIAWSTPIWSSPYVSSAGNPVVWTNTDGIGSPLTVYGYFVVDSLGELAWAERDPSSPVVLVGFGGTYSVGAALTYRNP